MIGPQSLLAELVGTRHEGFSCLEAVRDNDGTLSAVRCTYANAAAAQLLGMQGDALLATDLLRLLAPGGELHERGARVLRTGQPWGTFSLELNKRRVSVTLTRFFDSICLWMNDVSDLEALQARVEALQQQTGQLDSELHELRALFRTVFESSPLGIAVLDRSHRYVAMNEALAKLLGQSPGELIGKTPHDLWPAGASAIETVLDEVITTGQPRLGNELEILTPEGPKYLLFGSYPVKNGDEVLGTGSFIVDITDRKQVEEYQQQLIGIVSHDLRSPLQAVLIGAQMLLRNGHLESGQTGNVQRMLRSARRMSRLIDDLADFTRIRVGQPLSVTRRPANIEEICRQVLAEAESMFPGRRLTYHGAGDPRGHWDAGRLTQVLINLVTNAFKYSPPEVCVELAWWREPSNNASETHDDLVIEVRNGGAPVPAETLSRLFEPFQRGSSGDAMARTSLGLGLYIVKHLVKAHGGQVAVTSTEEAGTVFKVRVPSSPPPDLPVSRWRTAFQNVVPLRHLTT